MASIESCVVPFVNLLAVQSGTVLELPEELHDLYDTEFIPRRVYVRQEMIDLWHELATVPMPKWDGKHNIVTGSPGVGKSLAVYLFVLHVVQTCNVTFYHMRHLKGDSVGLSVCRLTRTSDQNSVKVKKIDSVTDISDLPRLTRGDVHPYTFVDGVIYHEQVDEYAPRISPVFWCSSVHAEIKSEQWVHVRLYGLSPWSFEDLKKAVVEKEIPDFVDEKQHDRLEQLDMHWRYLGGTFRGIGRTKDDHLLMCRGAVQRVTKNETQLQSEVAAGQKDSVTYTYYQVEDGALDSSCYIASDYYAAQLYERMGLKQIEQFLTVALQMSRSVYGGVFQAYVQKQIETRIEEGRSRPGTDEYKGYDWVIHMAEIKDDTGKWEDVTITVKEVRFIKATTLEDTLGEISAISSAGTHDGVLIMPKFEQFPLADWLIYFNGVIYLINATVGKSHSFKTEYLKGLLECMGWKEGMEFRAVYYEPDEDYCKEFKLKDNCHEYQRDTRSQIYTSIHPYIGYGSISISVSGPKIRRTRPVPPVVDLKKIRKITMVDGPGKGTLDEITDLADINNLRVIDVKRDGNCQFRAIAHATMGSEEYYQTYRMQAANQLTNGDYDAGVVLGDEFDKYEGDVERFAHAISADRSTVWGNQATLQAIADANRFEFFVLSTLGGIFPVTPREGEVTRTIVLGHYGERHYVCLENGD